MIVIIESPYSGNVKRNMLYLCACIKDCLDRDESPYASHAILTLALDDNDPQEREQGIQAGYAFHSVADKMVVYTDYKISSGMRRAIEHAAAIGLPIEYRTILGDKE